MPAVLCMLCCAWQGSKGHHDPVLVMVQMFHIVCCVCCAVLRTEPMGPHGPVCVLAMVGAVMLCMLCFMWWTVLSCTVLCCEKPEPFECAGADGWTS